MKELEQNTILIESDILFIMMDFHIIRIENPAEMEAILHLECPHFYQRDHMIHLF